MTKEAMTWLEDRRAADPGLDLRIEQEALILEVTEALAVRMDDNDMSKKDVAAALGKPKAYVTSILSGERNLRLKTLAKVFYRLGLRVRVSVEPLTIGKRERTP